MGTTFRQQKMDINWKKFYIEQPNSNEIPIIPALEYFKDFQTS